MSYHNQYGRAITIGHSGKVVVNTFTVYKLDQASTVVVV